MRPLFGYYYSNVFCSHNIYFLIGWLSFNRHGVNFGLCHPTTRRKWHEFDFSARTGRLWHKAY